MPLINDPNQVTELYEEVRALDACLPCYCAENRRTIETVLKAVHTFGSHVGVDDLPVILSFTAGYPGRGQMHWYVDIDDCLLGARAYLQDLQLLLSEGSPYQNLRVMLHLDHGQPDADRTFLTDPFWLDAFASVMHDCSALPFDENIEQTARYVDTVEGQTLVEGAVDEIAEAGSGQAKNDLTRVDQAERFVRETGAFLIVPNLGTEHRASAAELHYHSDLAREISAAVGKMLCIHGTSCIQPEDMPNLRQDGIVKINIWTGMERTGGKAVARFVLEQIGNIMSEEEVARLLDEGTLGPRFAAPEYRQACGGTFKPKLTAFPEIERKRRWMPPVVEMILEDLRCFGYEAFGA